MRRVLIGILFLLPFIGNAQVWCPPGATWSYSYNNVWGCSGIYRYSYIGDTSLNSINCKIIQKTVTYKCPWESQYTTGILENHYMYSDSDKVYFFKNNQFNLLYNFSVLVGDTINLISHSDYLNCDSTAKLIVDSIGVMTINSMTLRYYCVQPVSGSAYSAKCRIVEKIGPFYNYPSNGINYFFPVKIDTCGLAVDEEPEYGYFKCYRDDNFPVVSLSSDSCAFTLSVKDNNVSDYFVYPNPANSNITINSLEKDENHILIYNTLGEVVFETLSDKPEVTIDVSYFTEGVYFLKIFNKKNLSTSTKFLKLK